MKPRNVYTAEFKRKVLQEYYTTPISQGEIERKYNIGISCVCRWLKEDKHKQEMPSPAMATCPPTRLRLRPYDVSWRSPSRTI